MTKLTSLLFLCQLTFVTALTAQKRNAPDACSGSNKKSTGSYSYLSKRSAQDNAGDFSKPKYQHLYTRNAVAASAAKREPAAHPETKAKGELKSKPETLTPSEKNRSSKSERMADKKEEAENEQPELQETEKEQTAEPVEIPQTEEKGVDSAKPVQPVVNKSSGSKASHSPETAKPGYAKTPVNKDQGKQRQKKSSKRKKLCFGKKDPTSCPEF